MRAAAPTRRRTTGRGRLGHAAGVAEAVVDGELDDVGLLHGDAALQAVQEEGMDHGCGFGGAYGILND